MNRMNKTAPSNKADLASLGFYLEGRSTHNSRTIMLNELQILLQDIDQLNIQKENFLYSIIEDNCLGKRSGITRKISAEHLVNLYSLDPDIAIYKALLYFWRRDTQNRPLLALLCWLLLFFKFRKELLSQRNP